MDFSRHFEGRAILENLLGIGGCPLSANQVVEKMREAQHRGEEPSAVIPRLFIQEPRFSDPTLAYQLYGNLLGLWDLLVLQPDFDLNQPPVRRPLINEKTEPPRPFGEKGPDDGWVQACLGYLEGLDKSGLNRLQHSFENRQDALLGYLDEQNLTDQGFDCARQLLFELFAMIKLGWLPGSGSVSQAELEGEAAIQVPEALWSYAEEVLFEVETDEQSPLPAEETSRLRVLAKRGLSAMWKARRQQGE